MAQAQGRFSSGGAGQHDRRAPLMLQFKIQRRDHDPVRVTAPMRQASDSSISE